MEIKMLSIRDGEALSRALRSDLDHKTKALLRLRATQLQKDAPEEDIGDLVQFAIVQPGDTAADLERAIGFSVFVSAGDGLRLGEPGFSPGWEWADHHNGLYELCYVFSQDGAGVIIIIPIEPEIDPSLLNLCATYAPAHA